MPVLGSDTEPMVRSYIDGMTDPAQRKVQVDRVLLEGSSIGTTEVMRLALEKGADVDIKDSAGSTALHLSATGGHSDAVSLLLGHGASTSVLDLFGRTPLQLAAASVDKI